jgi:hypothetical protein
MAGYIGNRKISGQGSEYIAGQKNIDQQLGQHLGMGKITDPKLSQCIADGNKNKQAQNLDKYRVQNYHLTANIIAHLF